MHQSHNIAWDSLSSHLVFIYENRAVTPHRTDLFPRRLPSQGKSLNHFARTLASTIRAFSATERTKYPVHYDAPLTGPVFSDEILSRYSTVGSRYANLGDSLVTAQNQNIEHWIDRAGADSTYKHKYPGDLADIIKILLAEGAMDSLLMLAQHPKIPIDELYSIGWGHSFGWDHVMMWALDAYILFNVILAKPELHDGGRYRTMESYKRVVRNLIAWMDYDAQAFPHRQFLCGSRMGYVGEIESLHPVAEKIEDLEPLADGEKLHEYLKTCFRLLYQFDTVAKECGIELDWEGSIVQSTMWELETSFTEGEEGQWIGRFV
ncbi:hypothetical protein FB45DRAFT_915797 [Roridomyces roridus]|uniref:Uncharacterized protein n=1 Tax=Roridomyces roridus TaxID=1738132 RepID=A0AAD7BTQ6_9AGAR|nr:hypothetical protein FB45DRAFT_915797 [Roridomyces roridus]